MMVATFNDNPGPTIMCSYNPTNASDKTDLNTFYNKLSSLVRSILKHNVLIIAWPSQLGLHNTVTASRQGVTLPQRLFRT